ncbi:MAG: hemoblobin-interacting domain-containing protein, partial [Lachnospiraceae bacterium]
MKKFKEMKKFTSAFLVTAMVVGMLPADVALAVSGSQVAADGTYTKTAHVARTDEDDENEDFWTEYDVKVSLEVKDGVFSNITVIPENGYQASESQTYFAKAYNKSKGFQTLLKDKEATEDTVNGWDAVSGATRTSDAIKTAALDAIREAEEKTAEPEKTEPVYVLMNIPYADFYKADVNNEEPVDAFSSATLNKTRTASLAGGSYHVKADGSEITGITFPVKVEGIDLSTYKEVTDSDSVEITVTNRGQTSTTTYSGKDALFENESYAYYVLSEVPAYYKEASANADGTLSFGSVVGEIQKLSGIETELMTETSYGDYQLDLSGLDMIDASADQVYAVIVSTSEGSDYGMRHLENIWRVSELAWCTGFTKDVHGCPTSSAHYVNMMGQHINKVTYYTSKGIYEIPVDNLYVPVKFEGSVKVENADVSAGSTAVTTDGIPADFEAEYTVDGLTEAAVNDGILTFSKDAEEGQYTMNVTDRSGKYAPISTAFILMTDEMPAEYNGDDEAPALKAAEGASDEAFNKYLKNITSVTVNGTSYAATGRGAVVIVKEDGSIDTGVQDGAVFGENGAYEITVSSTGYHDLTFTYTKEEAAEPENPTEPENPAEPENPTEPENPAEPENPT